MLVVTVADLDLPESFTISVFTFTAPDSLDTCGVLTNVPNHATCKGAVTIRRIFR